MEIRQLEALNAIVTSGSVTAAGRMLGRSQPVVSRQISDLEAELGFMLFARTRPAITLTEQGAEFYQEVRGILADLHQLESRVQGMRSGQVRPLRILASVDLARSLLPEARRHAELLAARPISSLVAVKRTMTEPLRAGIDAARERENMAFAELMGGPANLEALTAFAEGREPDFTSLPPGW